MADSLAPDSNIKEHLMGIAKEDHDILYEAIEEGDEDTVKEILEKVPEIVTTSSDKYFCFYLHLACMHDQAKICEELLRYGAEVNRTDDQQDTPLHIALDHDASTDLIQALLNHGANVSSQNLQGLSPFHNACASGSLEYVEQLIKYAKGPLIETDQFGQNGLHIAVQNWNKFKTFEDLLGSIVCIVDSGVDLNAQDYNGRSVLHHASCHLGMNLIPPLLEMGVDPFLQDYKGDTFLTEQQYLPAEYNKILIDLVKKLEIDKSNVKDQEHMPMIKTADQIINLQNLSGKSVFHLFLNHMELSTLKFLLDKGADVNLQDTIGQSSLHISANKEDELDKLNLLIEYGGKVNSCDVHGRSSLFVAIGCKAAQSLIDNGSNPNIEDKLGMTPLHTATLDHRPDVIEVLIRSGSLVNKKDKYGSTALHYASWWNYETVIELLNSSGADSTIEDRNGNTAAYVQATDQVAKSFRIQALTSSRIPASGFTEESLTITREKT